ncbi:MAG: hypothetical protein JJ900_02985 [Rhodospirillales bacterium]|nr:hypothetical protein [Rhodospirillales bacterium]MBO6785789.1 hypothetical protein [Rhodospirillales bacterium]
MGNFDAFAVRKRDERLPRSVFKGSVGPNARNAPVDLHIITRTLASAGLLDDDACPHRTRAIIFEAIRHVRRTLTVADAGGGSDHLISPGDATERAVRRALAKGRLPLSHRAIIDTQSPRGARSVIDSGMKRALARLSNQPGEDDNTSPLRRAVLPDVGSETFHANRRLADAMSKGGLLPGLEVIIAQSFSEGGKQAFSDVRDFFDILRERTPKVPPVLGAEIEKQLSGNARQRFRKLRRGEPPAEGDFNE